MIVKLSIDVSINDAHTIGAVLGQAPPANYRQLKNWMLDILQQALARARQLEGE